MKSRRKKVYSDDLMKTIDYFIEELDNIEIKLGNDILINKGLFIMITAHFEDSIRELVRIVLVALPEKLTTNSCTISKKQLCQVADNGHSVIIDNEIYFLFKGGVKSQLEEVLKILLNKEYKKEKKSSLKNSITEEEKESILKLEEVSLYRNALVHNGGKVSREINEKATFFKPKSSTNLIFDSSLIKSFIAEYRNFFKILKIEILETFDSYENKSDIEKIEIVWKECFSSPILKFKDYWEFNKEEDVIIGIKYPEIENQISTSEEILLSIWRHQYDDRIKTKEFSLASINYNSIHKLYAGLSNLKFYFMKQKADRLK